MSAKMDFIRKKQEMLQERRDNLRADPSKNNKHQFQKVNQQVDEDAKKQQNSHLKTNEKFEQLLKKQQLNDEEPQNQQKIMFPEKIEKHQNQLGQEELNKRIEEDEELKSLPFLDIQIRQKYYLKKIENRNILQKLQQQYQELQQQSQDIKQQYHQHKNQEQKIRQDWLKYLEEHQQLQQQQRQEQKKYEEEKSQKQKYNQYIIEQYQQRKQQEQLEKQFQQEQQQEQYYIEIIFTKTKVTSQDNLECSICSQEYKNGDKLALLNCIHRFHQTCFKQWSQKSNACPYCRYAI